MPERPYVLLSCASSVDGYIDDGTDRRLVLSDAADADRVDEERAACDAILVGAATIRADDPRLLIRSPARQRERIARGLPPHPVKVTLTGSGDLDPERRFFTAGDTQKIVYAPTGSAGRLRDRLSDRATVVPTGRSADLAVLLTDLAERGVTRLMVEGGGRVHTAFLAAGLVDELQLLVAPFFVGDRDAPRFVYPATFPHDPRHPMRLAHTRRIGAAVLLDYLLDAADARSAEATARDREWLRRAVELSRSCPSSATAFSVGAIIVDAGGRELARGYSRESDPHEHAEQAALAKMDTDDPRLPDATIYSSLEPCSTRASQPRSCTRLILDAGIGRIVYAWREPDVFVNCTGAADLAAAGRTVVRIAEQADAVRRINAHLLT